MVKHVHFIANRYICFHLACLITFKHSIFGSRFDRSAQMLPCTLLVPALRSPMFLFVFRQRCVWHTDSWGAKQQVLRLEISNKSLATR
jgi:hypothetical protein